MFGLAGEPSRLQTFDLLSLRRRWKLIGLCGALFLVVTLLVVVFKPNTYTASTQLLVYVREIHLGPEPVVTPGSADLVQVQNEIEIIQSRGVLAAVVQSLGLTDDHEFVPASGLPMALGRILRPREPSSQKNNVKLDLAVGSLKRRVSVKRVGASHTILVSVTTSDARKSEQIANAIGRIALEARVDADQEGGRSSLRRQRLQGLGPSAYVISAAGVPGRPDGPRKIVIIPAAAAFGLALGAALALLLDFMNATVRTAAQIEHLGLECIGPVPLLRRPSATGAPAWAAERARAAADANECPSHPMLEQTLRRVRVAIENSAARSIGITSAVAQEGVTRIAMSLARACRGRKVLFVEAGSSEPSSLREAEPSDPQSKRPDNSVFPNEATGFDFLKVDGLADGLRGITGDPTWRMRCGPNELDDYDLVVVSLPPLEQGAEFRMAARNLDAILLVVKWGATEPEAIERAMAVSGVSPPDFIGAVLNMVDERMIGKSGDKFWNAEAALAAKRASFAFNA